jgi:1-deoxy-D-xylulose-5-phosphate reductoisomerase
VKRIAVLGSTGSIGTQALDILGQYPEKFEIVALSAHENIGLLEEQALRFRPAKIGVVNTEKAKELSKRLSPEIEVLSGKQALTELSSLPQVDMVLMSVVGISGLEATLAALKSGKDVALANKETLVAGGQLVMDTANQSGARIIPVDSEHSAVFQCLQGTPLGSLDNSFENHHGYNRDNKEGEAGTLVRKLLLTASGGPFRGYDREELSKVQVADALKHPRWDMGKKVTIDSATLMNKGLEVIEAKWLFGLKLDQIEVLVHPQSIVHSMVEFIDGSVIAQMAVPDMRLPILYAFTWPERYSTSISSVDFLQVRSLTFEKPDTSLFPCLKLAYDACRIGGTMPAVLNAANEVAVEKFLRESISFMDIPHMVERAMSSHEIVSNPSLDDILYADWETRELLIKGDAI